jgi:hypothetical protein
MRFLLILSLGLASLLAQKDRKRNTPPKPPEVEVVEATARRQERRVALDGRVRNSGERPIQGLVLLFDFMAPGRSVITTKRGSVEDGIVEPEQEVEFHVQLEDQPRAVHFRIGAEDGSSRDLKVVKGGPFPID